MDFRTYREEGTPKKSKFENPGSAFLYMGIGIYFIVSSVTAILKK